MNNTNASAQNVAFDLDLAGMALKAGRFDEALSRFTDIARQSDRSEAWCGIGYAKLGLILEHTTIAEVFFCFGKAKAASPEEADDVEAIVIQATNEAANSLYRLYERARHEGGRGIGDRMQRRILTTVGAVIDTRHLLEDKSLGVFAQGEKTYNFDKYLSVESSPQEARTLAEKVLTKCSELRAAANTFIVSLTQERQELNDNLESYLHKIEAAAPPEEQEEESFEEHGRKAYIETKRYELSDPSHKFHQLKAEALAACEKGKTADTLTKINASLKLFSEDRELLDAKKAVVNRLTLIELRNYLLPGIVLAYIICLLLGDGRGWLAILGVVTLILVIIVRWRTRGRTR